MFKIGDKIRDLRKARKVTLIELSEKTGVAQATLSRIETGVMLGTVESHQAIAETLGISLGDLYSDIDSRREKIEHTQPTEQKVEKRGKASIQVLTSSALKKKMLPTLITLESSSELSVQKEEVGVEKFVYCLKGEVEIKLDKASYKIKSKESLYFDASLPHTLKNSASKPAELFSVTSPPKI